MKTKATALAIILAMMVTAFCATISVSAEGPVNLAEGRPYTLTCDDYEEGLEGWINKGAPDTDPPSLLTDGKVRKAFQLKAGGDPIRKISVEFAGTYRTFIVDVSLEEASTVSSVKLDVIRRGNNRFLNVVKMEVKAGGAWQDVAFTETKTPVPEAQQYADEEHGVAPADQFFDVEEVFASPVANATNVRISFDTNYAGTTEYPMSTTLNKNDRAYIAQLDEIEVMGTKGGAAEPEVSEPEVSEPEVSEPEVSEHEVSEPEVSEPEVSEPEVSEPEVSEPEVSEPYEEPEVSEPEVSEPEISEPDGGEPSAKTGDAGLAIFAVLAVISGAAVVILKKKA